MRDFIEWDDLVCRFQAGDPVLPIPQNPALPHQLQERVQGFRGTPASFASAYGAGLGHDGVYCGPHFMLTPPVFCQIRQNSFVPSLLFGVVIPAERTRVANNRLWRAGHRM